MWGCLEDAPIDLGIVAELERNARSADAALRAIEERLAAARAATLADVIAARRTLRTVVDGMSTRRLRDACAAIEHLVADMEGLAVALALVRKLQGASIDDATGVVAMPRA